MGVAVKAGWLKQVRTAPVGTGVQHSKQQPASAPGKSNVTHLVNPARMA